MSGMLLAVLLTGLAVAWVGHACIWTALLNNIYGRPLAKYVLKVWRYATGLIILVFPALCLTAIDAGSLSDNWRVASGWWGQVMLGYSIFCVVVGGLVFPVLTIRRLL